VVGAVPPIVIRNPLFPVFPLNNILANAAHIFVSRPPAAVPISEPDQTVCSPVPKQSCQGLASIFPGVPLMTFFCFRQFCDSNHSSSLTASTWQSLSASGTIVKIDFRSMQLLDIISNQILGFVCW